MTKIIGLIPARHKSTRFPGKPLADIIIAFADEFEGDAAREERAE